MSSALWFMRKNTAALGGDKLRKHADKLSGTAVTGRKERRHQAAYRRRAREVTSKIFELRKRRDKSSDKVENEEDTAIIDLTEEEGIEQVFTDGKGPENQRLTNKSQAMDNAVRDSDKIPEIIDLTDSRVLETRSSTKVIRKAKKASKSGSDQKVRKAVVNDKILELRQRRQAHLQSSAPITDGATGETSSSFQKSGEKISGAEGKLPVYQPSIGMKSTAFDKYTGSLSTNTDSKSIKAGSDKLAQLRKKRKEKEVSFAAAVHQVAKDVRKHKQDASTLAAYQDKRDAKLAAYQAKLDQVKSSLEKSKSKGKISSNNTLAATVTPGALASTSKDRKYVNPFDDDFDLEISSDEASSSDEDSSIDEELDPIELMRSESLGF